MQSRTSEDILEVTKPLIIKINIKFDKCQFEWFYVKRQRNIKLYREQASEKRIANSEKDKRKKGQKDERQVR